MLFGGGTRAGFLGDVVLQYLALPLLALAVPRVWAAGRSGAPLLPAIFFCAALCLVPLLQLIPLPAGLRGALPGKAEIANAYGLFELPRPGWPLSLTPHATWLALMGLLAPLAVFFGVLTLSYKWRRRVCLLIVCVAAGEVFLGLLQLSQGEASPLRFYSVTNVNEAVGLFANRNHFAALLYAAMVFCGCWAIDSLVRTQNADTPAGRPGLGSSAVVRVAGFMTVLAILVMAQAMARSRGGLFLSMGALAGVLAIAAFDRRTRTASSSVPKLIGGAIAFAVLFSLQFALYRILQRFDADPLADLRVRFAQTAWQAAKTYLPFGSGAGSFVHVYPAFEHSADVTPVYANHAHNDIVEAVLEAGVPAVLLMALFAVWLVRRAFKVWRSSAVSADEGHLDQALKRGATIVLALFAMHSLVDYPLHTTALAAIAAVSCGLLFPPVGGRHSHHDDMSAESKPHHHSGHATQPASQPMSTPAAAAQHHTGQAPQGARPATRGHQRWEGPVEWPQEWQGQDKAGQAVHGPRTTPPGPAKPSGEADRESED